MLENIIKNYNKIQKAICAEKEHYKMYKAGKYWAIAKISITASAALFSTLILGGQCVSADTANITATSHIEQKQVANEQTQEIQVQSATLESKTQQEESKDINQHLTQLNQADTVNSNQEGVKKDHQNQTSEDYPVTGQPKDVSVDNSYMGDKGSSQIDQATDDNTGSVINQTDDQNDNSCLATSSTDAQVNDEYEYKSQVNSINKFDSGNQSMDSEHNAKPQTQNQVNENNEKIEQLVNQIQKDGGNVVQDKDQHFTYDQASDAVNDQITLFLIYKSINKN